jgi:hypothetical protein
MDPVVDGKGEPLGEHAIVTLKIDRMDACIDNQRVNIGNERVKKVSAKLGSLFFLEEVPGLQVQIRLVQNPDSYHSDSLNLFFAASQSINCASPTDSACARCRRTPSCQDGEIFPEAFRHKSSHRVSMALIFSSMVIFSGSFGRLMTSSFIGRGALGFKREQT